jgi:thioredoxin 1
MSKVIKVDNTNFEEVTDSGIVLLDFYADWCGPCRAISPAIETMAEDTDGEAKVCKVNVDDASDIASKFGVRSIPTFVFMKDGEVVENIIGASAGALTEKLEALIK